MEWAIPSPGDLPDPGIELGPPALQADSLPTELSVNQILISLNFAFVFFVSISFISVLIFMISFTKFGLCSLSSCFRCKFRLFI